MIIELYGLPGSGKTTFTHKLSENHLILAGFAQKKYVFKFIVTYPLVALVWAVFLLYETLITGTWSLLRYKAALLGATATNYIKAQEVTTKNVVIDEGFVQRLLSVAETIKTKRFLSFMIRYGVPKCGLLYIVRSSRDIVGKRYSHPDHPRMCLGQEYMSRWQSVIIHNNKIIEEIIISSEIAHIIHTP